jgi:predicted ATPase/DNA-binding CsgD family transcriptional regulator
VDASTSPAQQAGAVAGAVRLLPRTAPRHNLPVALTSFVGRECELEELHAALSDTRLLTLIGPGGSGKTRLALHLATDVLERFPGGVWWVDLAAVADGALVGAALAEVLNVRPLPGAGDVDACCAYLSSRQALVVLDNCEHVAAGAAALADALLRVGSAVVVLATSRSPLGVGGEATWRVPPLSLESDAPALFAARVRKAQRDFVLTDATAEPVARICRELDGQPLAIELAAASVRLLSVEQIAGRISDRFPLLTGGPRTATPRQQTLRASVDWSHELLSPPERILLRRVGVFAGGFSLEAAEAVCAGDGIESEEVLDLLRGLVDQSLVLADERGSAMRYRLLETVRQYALERLVDADEECRLRSFHRDAFLALAEEAGPQLETGAQRRALERLDPERANLAAALDYALRSEPPLALRFCIALYPWWRARGRLAEAELAQTRSLEACGEREPALRARVLWGRALRAVLAGDFKAAESHAGEALALAEQVGDLGTAARARCALGDSLLFRSPSAARTELARAAELAGTAGDDWPLVQARQVIALSYMLQDDHARTARANDDVAALAERLGSPYQVARRWFFIAWMAVTDGRLREARDSVGRMRAAVEEVGEPVIEAWADTCEALVDVWEGAHQAALGRLDGQLERALTLGAGMVVPMLLGALAFAQFAAGRLEDARGRLEGMVALVQGRQGYATSWALSLLAETQRLLADDAAARATASRARAVGELAGSRLLATRGRLTLGRLDAAGGEWTRAREHALALLDACAEDGHAIYMPGCLEALAEASAGLSSHEDAARLLGAAERARADIGSVRVPAEAGHWSALEDRLADALGTAAYRGAREQGAGLSLGEAAAWARRSRGARGRPPGGWDSLTPTEARVVELAAEGLTNPEIAERLFVARSTVKTHLAHIFRKLGVHNRAELTAAAMRRAG